MDEKGLLGVLHIIMITLCLTYLGECFNITITQLLAYFLILLIDFTCLITGVGSFYILRP